MKQYAVFRVGEEEFGIDILRVIEILNPVRIYSIPDMPAFLSGVINLRNVVIPLVDLRKKFKMKSDPDRERIIIVWIGKQRVGLIVDSVREISGFSDEEIVASPSIFKGFKPEYLTGLGKKGERVVILLNPDAILTAEEKMRLMESNTVMEAREDGGTSEEASE